jgi:hypothetical protein
MTHFNLKNVAIQGYDPVAYFKQGKALKGRKEKLQRMKSVVYYFRCQVIKNIS